MMRKLIAGMFFDIPISKVQRCGMIIRKSHFTCETQISFVSGIESKMSLYGSFIMFIASKLMLSEFKSFVVP